jgi:GMP synthase (glutamine-hydrolysing)
VLIVKTGTTVSNVVAERGDFEAWIARGMGVPEDSVHVCRVYEGEPLPDPSTHQGVVVTGSAAMVTERLDWSERTAGWLREAVESGVPVLGI